MNLYEVVKEALRIQGYAYKTEKTYLHWIKRFVRFLKPVHPRDSGEDGVKRFLTHLAVNGNVSPATQNQALAALLFLYKLYGIKIGNLDFVRAKKEKRLPTVLTVEETMNVIDNLEGVYKIMGQLLYGGGLRLNECLSLRVKDLDLFNRTITLRDTKSNRDRATCLPQLTQAVSLLPYRRRYQGASTNYTFRQYISRSFETSRRFRFQEWRKRY